MPAYVWIETLKDALLSLGKRKDWNRFSVQVSDTRQAHQPSLKYCSPRVRNRTWRPFTITSPNSTVELMEVVESLSNFPERDSYPKELVGLGIKEYRQTFFKPYRVIYRVTGSQIIIYLIAGGRHDMQSVLARRLLGT